MILVFLIFLKIRIKNLKKLINLIFLIIVFKINEIIKSKENLGDGIKCLNNKVNWNKFIKNMK